MKEQPAIEGKGYLELIIWVLPVLALPTIAEDIGGNIPEIAMAAILGGLGGIIGGLVFWLTKDQSKNIKYGALVLMIVVLVTIMIYFANRS